MVNGGTAIVILALTETKVTPLLMPKSQNLLRFWGFSYGTTVGNTFASMFPDRAERLVLDGSMDAEDYYRGDLRHSLNDADASMARLFVYCALAGSGSCKLNSGNDIANEIHERWEAIESRLYREGPIPVPAGVNNTADVITWSDLKNLVWSTSYNPLTKWTTLAELVAPLAEGNGTAFATAKQKTAPKLKHLNICPTVDPHNPDCAPDNYNWRYVWSSVQCADGDADRTATADRQAFDEYYSFITNQSVHLGAPWSWLRFTCLNWKGRPNLRPELPISSDRLRHPMLYVSNTRDNVTPLQNARTMAARFLGSRVLVCEGDGHCLQSNPSLCAAKQIRAYFQTGILPEEDSDPCPPHHLPFLNRNSDAVEAAGDLDHEEQHLLDAVLGLEKTTRD